MMEVSGDVDSFTYKFHFRFFFNYYNVEFTKRKVTTAENINKMLVFLQRNHG